MADWTHADVVLIAPEFESTPLAVVQRYVELAALEVTSDKFGRFAKHAGVLLTAHLMTVYGGKEGAQVDGSVSGAISSKAVGDVSVSYSDASASVSSAGSGFAGLGLTRYGIEYARLLKLAGGLGITVL